MAHFMTVPMLYIVLSLACTLHRCPVRRRIMSLDSEIDMEVSFLSQPLKFIVV
ncbi:MAG: hypothetical protein WB014_04105 [Methanosarcina sp.]